MWVNSVNYNFYYGKKGYAQVNAGNAKLQIKTKFFIH